MTHVLDWAIVVNVFGIGLTLGLALGLFVMSTILRVLISVTEDDE